MKNAEVRKVDAFVTFLHAGDIGERLQQLCTTSLRVYK